ncbi:polysaccharide deacetylase family protein [Marinobacter halotolerans]|uniref:polysaccharide deacetylase family protein n=1 Tax=Marinobacter halotolerans TaxID=1569211 RepID=UPI00124758AC|nr:polysaccharide deacetylase family protein [Marinobacter halotolerans]
MTLNDLIYRFARPLGGLQVAKYLARRHPRILMYHRISQNPADGAICVDNFRQQMQTIKRELNPISLDELISAHQQDAVPDNAVVITFDDGYADFYEHAFPVLKKEGLPSTLFVTTGFVNGQLWLWPDRLRYCVDQTTCDHISVPEINKTISISGSRHEAWNTLADHCLELPDQEKNNFIQRVADQLQVALPASAPGRYQGLNWDQVREVSRAGIEIGSHSVSHPILTSLDPTELENELVMSRETIEREIGQRVKAFCYPNGQPIDFNERVKSAVRAAGYEYALAAFPGRETLKDPWAIHRYPGSISTSMFEKTVYGFSYLRLQYHAS